LVDRGNSLDLLLFSFNLLGFLGSVLFISFLFSKKIRAAYVDGLRGGFSSGSRGRFLSRSRTGREGSVCSLSLFESFLEQVGVWSSALATKTVVAKERVGASASTQEGERPDYSRLAAAQLVAR
jgi:hypothetical protein